jgi:menaquinone-dependent protoporphyrinogen IX oxidase
MKDSYENIKLLLEKIRYEKYNWNDRGDLKIIVVLLGLQLSYTKVCCFLCEWDIRDRIHHYIQSQWP